MPALVESGLARRVRGIPCRATPQPAELGGARQGRANYVLQGKNA